MRFWWLVRWRRLLTLLHLIIALAGGALILTVTTSGSAVVFMDAIDHALNPDLQHASGPDRYSLDEMQGLVSRAYPSEKLSRVVLPQPGYRHAPLETYLFVLSSAGTTSEREVFVDAHQNRIVGSRWADRWIEGFFLDVHLWLIRRLLGVVGFYGVGVAGIFLFLALFSGVLLWWPLFERGFGLRIRWRAGIRRVTYDLHNVIGAYSLPVLLGLSLTGISLVFYAQETTLAHWLSRTHEPDFDTPSLPANSRMPAMPLSELTGIANTVLPDAPINTIYMPEKADQAIGFGKRPKGELDPFGYTRIWLDPHSGSVVRVLDGRLMQGADKLIYEQALQWHDGSAFGLTGRWIVFAAGLLPIAFMISGIALWFWRKGWSTPTRNQ